MINNKLLKEIEEYCKYNNIYDIESEINKILMIGFNVVRFGVSPFKPYDGNIDNLNENEKNIKIIRSKKDKVEKGNIDVVIVEEKKEDVKMIEEPIVKKKVRIIKNK